MRCESGVAGEKASQSVSRLVGLSGCYWARSEAGRREEYILLCTKVNANLILCTSSPSLNRIRNTSAFSPPLLRCRFVASTWHSH